MMKPLVASRTTPWQHMTVTQALKRGLDLCHHALRRRHCGNHSFQNSPSAAAVDSAS